MQVRRGLDIAINEAKYTYLLNQLVNGEGPDGPSHIIWNRIMAQFSSFDSTNTLADMFLSMYRYYEICDKDASVFYQCVVDTYNEHMQYYKDLKSNYDKEYDYSTGNRKIVSRSDESRNTNKNDTISKSNGTSRDFDLPNKVVNPNSEDGYLTGKKTSERKDEANNESESETSYDSSITTIYMDEFLTLKNKYLNQIRNLYHEFCEKFYDCFLHIY